MASEIVKMVAKKAKISEPVAQIAVDTVLNLLKDKLPPAVGSTLDVILGSGSVSKSKTVSKSGKKTVSKSSKKDDNPLGGLGNIAGALGSLLGKK